MLLKKRWRQQLENKFDTPHKAHRRRRRRRRRPYNIIEIFSRRMFTLFFLFFYFFFIFNGNFPPGQVRPAYMKYCTLFLRPL